MKRLGPATSTVGTVGTVGLAVPVALLVIVLVLSPTRLASSAALAPTRAHAASVDPAALRLLERAAAAPGVTPYHGLQFVSAWNRDGSTGVVVDVDHRPGLGTSVRSEGTAQSPAADTYLPAGTTEPSIVGGAQMLALLADTYDVVATGAEHVAGRTSDVVEARRPGGSSPVARFWIDRASGLVLRREVYDERGRLTRASAFVEVEIGRASTAPRASATAVPDAWSQGVAAAALAPMRRRGWTCPYTLPGSLHLVDARRSGQNAAMILHLSYSDGLWSVSLFQQRGRLDSERLEGYRKTDVAGGPVYVHDAVPQRVVWSSGGTVFTMVADAPARTVDQIVAALPRPRPEQGAWDRLGRGVDRVASWFNPFQ